MSPLVNAADFDGTRRARVVESLERLVAEIRELEPDYPNDPEFQVMLRWAEDTLEEWR